VSCTTAQDVSETISFLMRQGLDVAIRSGGHSFAGHSTTRGVLVDVDALGLGLGGPRHRGRRRDAR
jgi:FAD/FMN-containing dehydrogenase